MVMSRIETLMSRRQVQAMIQADSVDITVTRVSDVPDGVGGTKRGTPTQHGPYTVSIIPAKRRLSELHVNSELGAVVKYPFILLAPHFTDILRDDEFSWNGDRFVVKSIYIETDVSVTAQIDYFGGEHNG